MKTKKIYSCFPGRYQPLHTGHIELIRTVLNEGKNILVALRDTGINKQNPYSIKKRKKMFKKEFQKEINKGKLKIIVIDDISEICYGRGVGWKIREIKLSKKIESISATKIRGK